MRRGLDDRLALGVRGAVINHFTALAERCLAAGRIAEGLALVAAGRQIASAGAQRYFDAELWRLEGELQRQSGGPDGEAERALTGALATARAQGARGLELRAAASLGRLWAGQGRRREAHDLLAAVYAGFTEGFDTADLRQARELLDEWGRP